MAANSLFNQLLYGDLDTLQEILDGDGPVLSSPELKAVLSNIVGKLKYFELRLNTLANKQQDIKDVEDLFTKPRIPEGDKG